MNLPYLVPRVVRHFLPERLTRWLLLRSLIIKPGLESADPGAAVRRYEGVLQEQSRSLKGQKVLVFGYGGRFDIGVSLLRASASHVTLCDPYAPLDHLHNAGLLASHPEYLVLVNQQPRPRPEYMELAESDVQTLAASSTARTFDVVISNSVFEHVEDAEGITESLARLTGTEGIHIHFVDLRDHYFKFPFEMLRYREDVWRRWLNPTSNHNRLRLWDYRRIFDKHFANLEILVLDRDEAAFKRVQDLIRPEFRSGNLQDDAVTLIRIVASIPRP